MPGLSGVLLVQRLFYAAGASGRVKLKMHPSPGIPEHSTPTSSPHLFHNPADNGESQSVTGSPLRPQPLKGLEERALLFGRQSGAVILNPEADPLSLLSLHPVPCGEDVRRT